MRPHHFQAADRHLCELVATSGRWDNAYNYGVRTLVSSRHGLFVGTANPFGPEVPARLARGWTYVENPSGGAEVWRAGATIPASPEVREDGV